jgi:hypothetical protein
MIDHWSNQQHWVDISKKEVKIYHFQNTQNSLFSSNISRNIDAMREVKVGF